jgi:RNA polymerase sigma factor (TIGR02999 family)
MSASHQHQSRPEVAASHRQLPARSVTTTDSRTTPAHRTNGVVVCITSRLELAPRTTTAPMRHTRAQCDNGAHAGEVVVNEIDESVTGLIHAWNAGDSIAGDRLFALVYGELRTIARSIRRRSTTGADETLDTTALVHEVYLRLAGAAGLHVQNRGHFFAVAVRASRQIISNYARNAQAQKRGGTRVAEDIAGPAGQHLAVQHQTDRIGDDLSALEEALQQLEQLHPRPCRVVECRYFGGLSIADTALALNISEATVKRDWTLAQAWLHRTLRDAEQTYDA